MKLTTGVLASALVCCAHLASAATGYVYTYDPSVSSQHVARSRLDPATARLVLAHRAGVEDYHVDTALREDEIEQINALGSKESLFGGKGRQERMFMLALDKGEGSDVLASKASAMIAIDPAPAAPATKDLLADLEAQHRHDIDASDPTASGDYDTYTTADSLSSLEAAFDSAMAQGIAITALVMPAHEYARTGSGSYQWGTYRMPSQTTLLKKREQPQREKPLSAEPTHSGSTSLESGAPMTDYASNDTSPLRGILPACYRSKDECEKSTRSCSGHGKCYKKYHDQDAASGAKGDCYACACSATKEKIGSNGGVKTTHWGGPACQKKDVSMSFWLIALFTVGLVFVVSFAVGQIYSMGSEELPSVIGAGVSGPVRK